MPDIDITVRGAHTQFAPPERATVELAVGVDGSDASAVYRDVATTADAVRRSIEPLHDPGSGPVTWWSSQQIGTWATRPWNQEGKTLPLVHHARVPFSVKFADFGVLASWIATTAELGGTSVVRIDWALTAAHRERLLAEVRRAAVHDAVAKAQAYADAVDAGKVRVLAIADAGMLGNGLHPTQGPTPKFARMAAAADAAPSVELAPEDIAIAVEVDVRCVAG